MAFLNLPAEVLEVILEYAFTDVDRSQIYNYRLVNRRLLFSNYQVGVQRNISANKTQNRFHRVLRKSTVSETTLLARERPRTI